MCKNSKTGCGCHHKDINVVKNYSFPVAGAKGEDGVDGLTPYIGNNGNWWVGSTDTGVAATIDSSGFIKASPMTPQNANILLDGNITANDIGIINTNTINLNWTGGYSIGTTELSSTAALRFSGTDAAKDYWFKNNDDGSFKIRFGHSLVGNGISFEGLNIYDTNGIRFLKEGDITGGGGSGDVTTTGTQTLTNKTMSGESNTFLNIPAAAIDQDDVQVVDLSLYATLEQVQQMIEDAIAGGGGQPVTAPAVVSDTNTAAWFKAEDQSTITKDGSNNVSEWRDSLGRSASLATPEAGREPVWSSAGIAFTTAVSKLYALMPIPQPITIYMVVKQFGNFTDTNRLFYGENNVTSYGIANGGEPLVYLQAPNDNFATRINPYGEFNVVKFVLNGANSKILVNNFTEQVGNAGTNAMADFTLGTLYDGFAANTQYKEIIIRKVADNSTDETAIFNYLKNKYSI